LLFTVQRLQCGARRLGTGWTMATAKGVFCVVTVAVRNDDDQPHTVFMGSQQAHDATRNTYSADAGAWWYHPPARVWGTINPGLGLVGDLVFDIPAGVTLTELVVRDSLFSTGTRLPLR
jgi:hypothetical protein